MQYVATASEMMNLDTYAIKRLGIPNCVLMERAALGVTEEIMRRFPAENGQGKRCHVLIAAGCGNNGGDGLAVGRQLIDKEYDVDVVMLGELSRCTKETERQYRILQNYNRVIGTKIEEKEYDIIVDALFGIGLSRDIGGEYAEAVHRIMEKKAYKVAVDIPSGIDADNGQVLGCAVKADMTVTFTCPKRGQFLFPGTEYTGELVRKDIGIPILLNHFDGLAPRMYTYEDKEQGIGKHRSGNGNKGTFGKVLLLAGSTDMSGAAILAGRAAYRTGAGMVKIATVRENRIAIQASLPEALLMTYPAQEADDSGWRKDFQAGMEWADVIAAGPGLSLGANGRELLLMAIDRTDRKLVLDADALNLLAKDDKVQKALKERNEAAGREVILTPHLGELARLLGEPVEHIKAHLTESVQEAADKYGCVVAGKDARTVVCRSGESEGIYLNVLGNSGMATAGSGDVLTGMIAALYAGEEASAFQSAVSGVYLHARAGDAAAVKIGEAALMASDLAAHIKVD